ncbi:MAG: prenyltransferase/squalene oxidase repeat-containing protein [Pirellulaceae bacterium]
MSHEASRHKRPEHSLPRARSLDPSAPPAPSRDDLEPSLAPVSPHVQAADAASVPPTSWRDRWTLRETASFLVSLIVHVAVILILSLLVISAPLSDELTLVVDSEPGEGLSAADMDSAELMSPIANGAANVETYRPLAADSAIDLPESRILFGPAAPTATREPSANSSSASQILRNLGPTGGGLQGRRGDRKGLLLGKGEGTRESENAVALGLAWLAAHQWQDGGWRFDLSTGPCGGQCRHSGSIGTTTGATGLALLPFLGAGQTHLEGEYRDVVHAGVYYLKNHMVPTPHGADLQEGTMYAQGIATIALCEAYGMTQDESLRQPAQRAVNFICWAQHSAGGWRYYPGQPGDTTVFGWQMMALKSAAMAGLDVPSPVLNLAERFLDSVQSGGGSYYGYMVPARSAAPTAIGLLIRMYTGWEHYDPRLQRGVAFLAKEGPSKTDMYFNYYATQVLHHYGGPAWTDWNEAMRDYLVRTQTATGHERGSWFFLDQHGVKGGRLYTTAMCTMILEVYYRHMPLYESSVVVDDL